MNIHLLKELESNILTAVQSGRYASLDDAMSEAASLLVQRLRQEQAQAKPPEARMRAAKCARQSRAYASPAPVTSERVR